MPEGVSPVEDAESGAARAAAVRPRPRRAAVALAVAGLLAVTAVSATVTVAVGRPAGRKPVAAAKSAAPTVSSSPSAGPTPSPAVTPTQSAAPAPAPSSTVHGTVDGSTHGGDLRYFLLPLPDGAEVYGSADGLSLSQKDVSAEFGNADQMGQVLDSYGYQDDAATRHYRTADGRQDVTTRLLRFKSRQMAKEFARGMSFKKGDSFEIDGDGDAQGVQLTPEQQAWTGELIGVSSVGDVEYEVTVMVKGTPDKALLVDAMKRQRDRLASGG
ncbi:hypothetical protein CFP65_3970 [Kitasatospora sp. MMS16-BH015]|nr:hypothetical protein CFP65_3970 [Kitasatospora sp. MMS16-BH015]